MRNILNITNGDSSVEIMKKAGIPGEFLPWRDVLHEGPVPGKLSLQELSAVRAEFIAGQGWGSAENIRHSFVERDNMLASHGDFENVILWFEHDLYDQLQILQILDWFAEHQCTETTLSLICTDQYLGLVSPDEMADLPRHEIPVGEAELGLGQRAWAAFREQTPEKWRALLTEDTSDLQFLKGAITRMLEEYPNSESGLSRTEHQALVIIYDNEKDPTRIFARNQKLEERVYLGDASFWNILNQLLESSPPLVSLSKGKKLAIPVGTGQELTITSEGLDVLSGRKNWLDNKELNRWIGGVHLTRDNVWCLDKQDGLEMKRA